MANMFSGNQEKKIPRNFKECYKTDCVTQNLWLWCERLEKWGKILFWVLIIVLVTLLLSAFEKTSLFTNLSSTISSIGNVGFNVVGSDFCYGVYSPFGKILLSFVMLAGRLEIFPLLLLFMPRTWRKA